VFAIIDNYNIEVGRRLYNARKRKDLTMKEVAVLVGLHESSIQRYESGNIKNLSIEKLKDFAKVLDMEAEVLIGWDKEIEPLNENEKEVHSFTCKLVLELLKEGMIEDPNNIPEEIIETIISTLKMDLKKNR